MYLLNLHSIEAILQLFVLVISERILFLRVVNLLFINLHIVVFFKTGPYAGWSCKVQGLRSSSQVQDAGGLLGLLLVFEKESCQILLPFTHSQKYLLELSILSLEIFHRLFHIHLTEINSRKNKET